MSVTQPNQGTASAALRDAIRPFDIEVSEEELADLRRRVSATRWPDRETDPWQGVRLETIQALARYWATDYDWRTFEKRFAALPHFITEIDGVDIHFIHVRSPHEDALPLIVTHGWPGSTDRAAQDHRAADRSHRPRRQRGGCVPSRHPVAAGPRVLGQADGDRLGPDPHRARLGRADEAPRVRAVRGAGRRLGECRHRADGAAEARWAAGYPHQHAGDGSARRLEGTRERRPEAGRPLGRRGPCVRDPQALLQDRRRVRQRDGEPPADAVRHRGFAGRACGLDARSRRAPATS